jgi:hypothetical protein
MEEEIEFEGRLSHEKTPDGFRVQGTITPIGSSKRCTGKFKKPPNFPLLVDSYGWSLWVDDVGKLRIAEITGSDLVAGLPVAFSFNAELVEPAQ